MFDSIVIGSGFAGAVEPESWLRKRTAGVSN